MTRLARAGMLNMSPPLIASYLQQSKGHKRVDTIYPSHRQHQEGTGDTVMAEEQREELLTVHEVAQRLRVDDTTVRRWIKSGAMEAVALPHQGKRQAYRVKKTTLDDLFSAEPASNGSLSRQ
jgi:excisionase family DNA binding protein